MVNARARIPDEFIERVIHGTDIVELVGSLLPLKKSGQNYSACCPFHQEKTPSFTVSASKQFYHCFGCSAHGDAIEFVSRFENIGFVESLSKLASRLGLEVPKTQDLSPKAKSSITALESANQYFQTQLRKHPCASMAVDYLKGRNISGLTAKHFQLGFAPKGWDGLIKWAARLDIELDALEDAGLVIRSSKDRCYDRFRERIIFPIRNTAGKIMGFGGRLLQGDQAKYLNSPQTPYFNKSESLYGLYEALKDRQNWQDLLVVEGYIDVIALHQVGITGCVATLGTALTEGHLNRLFRRVDKVVLCFDGDQAGIKAAYRAFLHALPMMEDGRQLAFLFLPKGEDPDSYVQQHGKDAFLALKEHAIQFSDYFFDCLNKELDPKSVDERAAYVKLAKPWLNKIPGQVLRELMWEQLAIRVNFDKNILLGRGFTPKPFRRDYPSVRPRLQVLSPAIMASLLMLETPDLAEKLYNQWWLQTNWDIEGLPVLRTVLFAIKEGHQASQIQSMLQEQRLWRLLEVNLAWLNMVPPTGQEQEFVGAIHRIERQIYRLEAKKLLEKAKNTELTDEEKQALKKNLNLGESNARN